MSMKPEARELACIEIARRCESDARQRLSPLEAAVVSRRPGFWTWLKRLLGWGSQSDRLSGVAPAVSAAPAGSGMVDADKSLQALWLRHGPDAQVCSLAEREIVLQSWVRVLYAQPSDRQSKPSSRPASSLVCSSDVDLSARVERLSLLLGSYAVPAVAEPDARTAAPEKALETEMDTASRSAPSVAAGLRPRIPETAPSTETLAALPIITTHQTTAAVDSTESMAITQQNHALLAAADATQKVAAVAAQRMDREDANPAVSISSATGAETDDKPAAMPSESSQTDPRPLVRRRGIRIRAERKPEILDTHSAAPTSPILATLANEVPHVHLAASAWTEDGSACELSAPVTTDEAAAAPETVAEDEPLIAEIPADLAPGYVHVHTLHPDHGYRLQALRLGQELNKEHYARLYPAGAAAFAVITVHGSRERLRLLRRDAWMRVRSEYREIEQAVKNTVKELH